MTLDTRLPLMAQQPDIVNALSQSSMAAQQTNQVRSQNALRNLFQTQGADIAAGQPQALNALAQLDPMQALKVQGTRQAMDQRRAQEGRLQGQYELEVKKYAASLDAAERKKQLDLLQRGIHAASGAKTPEEWDILAQQFGQPELVGQFGQKDALLRQFMTAQQIMEREAPKPADEYGRYAAEERAAGRQPLDRIQYAQAKRGSGFSFTAPDGSVFSMGGATSPQGAGVTVDGDGGLVSNPEYQSMPEGVDFSDATGAPGFISQLGNTISDALGTGLIAPNNERATQAMENLSTNTMVTLADGVAGKPSNFLLQEFQKLSSTPNSVWQGEGRTRERLNQTRSMLEQAIMMNQDVANTSETATMRSKARANIARLSRLLSDYDVVIDSFGKRETGGAGSTTQSGISWSVVE
ncbi:hypothetical protein [Phaeobacter piscinae]|uniref:hypothetical protein n=1 Tax=Phaeobacter piscinae TaxID=1580596 RepID=UPI0005914767|nr:hypothetical protein [Phaeobacter piscinae]UTS79761.1 hypothetical protein OL67_000810 [Phaeobacter piscinae]